VFNIDLVSMKLVVTKEEENAIDDTESENGLKIFSEDKKIRITSTSGSKKQLEIFSVGGQKMHSGSFVYNASVALAKGYYIVKVTDNKDKLCEKVGVFN
ncbi:MAG: T9SS type A sorting domain-containing protein, partial [Paludibacter sp.]|nr:T9SS type A sorting domain-containing protein [Paludibacter sp.]